MLLLLSVFLMTGCPPDLAPHLSLALPTGQVVPVYALGKIAIRYAGSERGALSIHYETELPIDDAKALEQEAITEIFPLVAPRAERQLLTVVSVRAIARPIIHVRSLFGLPLPLYTWQWRWYGSLFVRGSDGAWRTDGTSRVRPVSDTARAVAVAIDSVERLAGAVEHVLQFRRDDRGIVVTVAAVGAGPMDGETDVRVNSDGRIWSVEQLH
jgi:hypothetical protein